MTNKKRATLMSRVKYGAAKYAGKAAKELLKENLTENELAIIVCCAPTKQAKKALRLLDRFAKDENTWADSTTDLLNFYDSFYRTRLYLGE